MQGGLSPMQLLSVSPSEADHSQLRDILRAPAPDFPPEWSCDLQACATPAEALEALSAGPAIAIVFCEDDLRTGAWKDLLQQFPQLPRAPVLIVTSNLADEDLW